MRMSRNSSVNATQHVENAANLFLCIAAYTHWWAPHLSFPATNLKLSCRREGAWLLWANCKRDVHPLLWVSILATCSHAPRLASTSMRARECPPLCSWNLCRPGVSHPLSLSLFLSFKFVYGSHLSWQDITRTQFVLINSVYDTSWSIIQSPSKRLTRS